MRTRTPSTPVAPPRVIYYVDPTVPARPAASGVVAPYHRPVPTVIPRQGQVLDAHQVAEYPAPLTRRRQDSRFLLGLGAATGTAMLAGLFTAGWFIAQADPGGVLIVVTVLAGVLVLAGVSKLGHHCITEVRHWH